jgi:integrase/recombinase XerD
LENCIRRIAKLSLHFGKLPDQLPDDKINEYFCSQALSAKSPSLSNFKNAVYGLHYYFRLIGQKISGPYHCLLSKKEQIYL